MYRRVVSLLLLPTLLLTQSAALGHAHEDHEHNDPRPHFHLCPIIAGHSHSPGEHHLTHAMTNDDSGHEFEVSNPISPPADHDSSAVFTATVDFGLYSRSAADVEYRDFSQWAAVWLNLFSVVPWSDQPWHAITWPHSLPPSGHACPIYVRHSALLI